jgi:hypothetical protein
MKTKLSPRTTLVIIGAMFLLPLLLAWFMHSGTIEYRPASTRNLGTLVVPPVPISWEDTLLVPGADDSFSGPLQAFSDHWVILYAVPYSCLENCLREVTNLRQIHRASGRHQSRIRIALLISDPNAVELHGTLRGIHSKFILIHAASGKPGMALEQASGATGGAYLIDPLGNIMMAYETRADPNFLKQDLKRLLTWSKLDEQQ